MQEKARGMVVHTVRYGDSSVIADVYTDKYGMLSFLVKTKRRGRDSVRNLLLCPLAIVEVDFDYREGKSLLRIGDVRLVEAYRSLPYHPVKATIAMFLSEFLLHALRNEEPNQELFAFVVSSMLWLDNRAERFANFPVTFLLRLTRFLGIWPSEEEVVPILHDGERQAVKHLLRMNYGTMHLFHFTRGERSRLMQVVNDYYRLHVPSFPELKSVAVLREVLS